MLEKKQPGNSIFPVLCTVQVVTAPVAPLLYDFFRILKLLVTK